MTDLCLKNVVASAVKRNLAEWQQKFAVKSLDEKLFADGEMTLKDRLTERLYDPEDYCEDDEIASLLPAELDRLWDGGGGNSIVGHAERHRMFAEAGRGWRSSLDVSI